MEQNEGYKVGSGRLANDETKVNTLCMPDIYIYVSIYKYIYIYVYLCIVKNI